MDAGGGDSGLRNPGWQSRLGERTGMSVCVGAAVGTLLSVLRNEPALSTAARTSGSFGIIGATFFSFSELCRLLRQEDGRANSVLAGAASGALLRGVHHGRGFVLPGAIGGSLLAWAGHGAVALWRDGLPDDSRAWEYIPVRKLTDEEVEQRRLKFEGRVKGAVATETPPAKTNASS